MFDLDKWQEIYHSLGQHKLRTGLTAFGVIWGIFMLVMLLGVGNGLRNNALSEFGGNTNTVYIWSSGKTQIPYQGFDKGRQIGFRMEDKEALKQGVPEADLVLEINELGGWASAQYVVHGDKSDSFITRGTHAEVAAIQSLKPVQGRFINKRDYDERRKVAVIGSRVYEALFEPGENPLGQSINVGKIYFKVVGVFEPQAAGDNAIREAELILIPNSTLQYTFNQTRWVGHFRLIPKPGIAAKVVEDKALNLLREIHHVAKEDTGVFGSFNTEETFNKVDGLFTGIRLFSWFVALGTIVAGVIGVGNIMLIIVKERTREIGLRKALGATAGSIIYMVVQEAIVITSVAGYIGLVLGVFTLEMLKNAAEGVQNLRFLAMAEIDFQTAILAIFALITAGFFAALLPAQKAAQVNPITALQDE
jgi:putative ABC transport system permease protein